MFGQHVSSHLTSCDLLKLHLLFLEHSVPHKVVSRQNQFGSRMVDRVVNDVQSRLTVDTHLHWGGREVSHHLVLELSEAGLRRSCRKLHVLTLARSQAGVGDEFGLPADSSPSREKHEAPSTATRVRAGEVACITVPPQLS